jgi:hypothetical protein
LAADHRAVRALQAGDAEAVGEAHHVLVGQAVGDAEDRVAKGGEVGLVQAAAVDRAHAARDHVHAQGAAQDERVELLARLGGVLLGVVQGAQRAQLARGDRVVVEQHPGGDQRAGEAAAPGLVRAGHQARAERAVESEQAPAAGGALAGAAARAAGARG